jgi:hypothetical protein
MFDITAIMIPLCGMSALFLLLQKSFLLRTIGSIIGLIGQPFWFVAMLKADNIGVMIMVFVYTALYAYGVYTNYKEYKCLGK